MTFPNSIDSFMNEDVLAYYERLAEGGKNIDVLKIRRSHLSGFVAIARSALARLSPGVAEPPAEDREGVEYDRGLTARRILNWAGKHDADGKLVGVAVGTDERNVTVDAATMVRLLNKADDERRRADYYEDEMTEFLFRDPGGGA